MEAKEKLVKLLYEWEGHRFKDEIANAIIEAFPQIEKKPIKIESYEYDTPYKKVEYAIKLFQPFDSKLERMQWIERHYCEVFE